MSELSGTNRQAVALLKRMAVNDPEHVVESLVRNGFIDNEEMDLPESYAYAAARWVSADPNYVYNCASGWSSDSWSYVLFEQGVIEDREKARHDIKHHKAVFAATVILAKQAGISL